MSDTRSLLEAYLPTRRLTLPPKPPDADGDQCPKCGWAGSGELGWKNYIYLTPEDAVANRITNGECLFVSCSRCKFRWHEPVLTPSEKPS